MVDATMEGEFVDPSQTLGRRCRACRDRCPCIRERYCGLTCCSGCQRLCSLGLDSSALDRYCGPCLGRIVLSGHGLHDSRKVLHRVRTTYRPRFEVLQVLRTSVRRKGNRRSLEIRGGERLQNLVASEEWGRSPLSRNVRSRRAYLYATCKG